MLVNSTPQGDILLDPQERGVLRIALGELQRSHDNPGMDALEARSLRSRAMKRIEELLSQNPEVKNPVGGNIDMTTQDKGSFIDKKV